MYNFHASWRVPFFEHAKVLSIRVQAAFHRRVFATMVFRILKEEMIRFNVEIQFRVYDEMKSIDSFNANRLGQVGLGSFASPLYPLPFRSLDTFGSALGRVQFRNEYKHFQTLCRTCQITISITSLKCSVDIRTRKNIIYSKTRWS